MHDVCIFILIVSLYLPQLKSGPQEPCPPKSWSWASPSSGEKLSGWVNGEFPMDFYGIFSTLTDP